MGILHYRSIGPDYISFSSAHIFTSFVIKLTLINDQLILDSPAPDASSRSSYAFCVPFHFIIAE